MRAPLIDGRNYDKLLEQLRELAPFYTPEWNASDDKDAGVAVLKIFAHMYMGALQRLNQVPDKNLIAFLNMLGLKLLPAMQASGPVTFYLSTGATAPILVPAGTQVASPPAGGGEPIIFETAQSMLATPVHIVKAFSVNGGDNLIFEAQKGFVEEKKIAPYTGRLLAAAGKGDMQIIADGMDLLEEGDLLQISDKEYAEVAKVKDRVVKLTGVLSSEHDAGALVERTAYFELFNGKNKQEHILYLGHHELFNIRSTAATIELVMSMQQNVHLLSGMVTWQYWNDAWIDFQTDGKHRLVLSKDGDEIKEREVDGITNRWIRCVMDPAAAGHFPDLMMDRKPEVKVTNAGVAPDLIFYNDIPVDFTNPNGFYLFGEQPRLYDTVYIACKEALSKVGSWISLEFTLDSRMPEGTFIDRLSWEYWNGSGWIRLKIKETTDVQESEDDSNTTVTLSLQNPHDLSPVGVQGQLQYWIRCRVTGIDKKMDDNGNEVPSYEAPSKIIKLFGIAMKYAASLPVQHCLTYNNLEYRNRSEEQAFYPFYAPDHLQAMYLGFDNAPLKGPISIYFSLEEQVYLEDEHPVVKWEYYAEQNGTGRWVKLEAEDGTNHLTQSGCVEFIGLPDFSRVSLFGHSLYWIRAVDAEQKFQHKQPGLHTDVPAPKINGIYLNTTMAYQAESYKDEILGSSRGTANQSYSLMKYPVITEGIYVDELNALSEGERKRLKESGNAVIDEMTDAQGNTTHFWVKWTPVEDLKESGPSDRFYEIDRTFGKVQFGDGIHGSVPPIGLDNIKANYRAGGGTRGNVGPAAISMLKTSIAFVDRVSNPAPSDGGFDTEMIESAIERGPHMIRHRNRAVTIEDYENLAMQASRGIARVKCLPNTNDKGQFETGWVTVLIVPQSSDPKPKPSALLIRHIAAYLRERVANVVASPKHVLVAAPAYAEITVQAVLVAASFDSVPLVEKKALHKIRSFLHPLTGGLDGRGWEFGRLPFLSDFFALLESIEGLDHVEKLTLTVRDAESGQTIHVTDNAMEMTTGPNVLVFSGNHQFIVKGMIRAGE